MPLFKRTPRLETPEKESRTRQAYSAEQCACLQQLFLTTSPTCWGCFFGNMDVRSVEEWSKGSREMAVLDSRQHSPRGGQQQREESCYEPALTLMDSGSDPRAWLALVQPAGTCAAHATSPEYLRHSPCPSTGSYHGEKC